MGKRVDYFVKKFLLTAGITIIFCSGLSGQQDLVSGLYFSSHEVVMEDRTSLDLTPEDPFHLPDGFTLDFDVNFRRGDGYYGYIFRIIGDGETNIDLVANLASTGDNFWLVVKEKVLVSYGWNDIAGGNYDEWMNVRVEIDTDHSTLAFYLNGIRREVNVDEIERINKFDVVFGAKTSESFLNTDVCPMSLKDIRLFDSNNQIFRHWKLSKHGRGEYVYDEIDSYKAYVENPDWLIDRHIKWRKRKSFDVDPLYGVSRDPESGRVFFIDDSNLYLLNTESWLIDTISFTRGEPYKNVLEKPVIYNKYTGELWSYDFNNPEISKFDFNTGKWSIDTPAVGGPYYNYSHHNKFISPIDSSLVTIFGYGQYRYKGIVNHFDPDLKNWEKIDRSDQIEPRYLSGAGFADDRTILVFGGYGNESGRQELSPKFFYDLHAFNLDDFSFEKIWTMKSQENSFVPAEDLIFNNDSNCLYTLVFNNLNSESNLQLARISIDEPRLHLYDETIPFKFHDTSSWVNLFLNHETKELVAVIVGRSGISVHTMAYPPLESQEVFQDVAAAADDNDQFSVLSVAVLSIIIFVIVYLIIRLRRRKSQFRHLTKDKGTPAYSYGINNDNSDRVKKSSILLIGGFQVFDALGNDITSDFSPKMKELFLFIFFNTIKNGRGVASSKIDENIWGDKTEVSAKNNRNVNISKLRHSLEKIGDVKVLCENSMWKIGFPDSVYCDYMEVLRIIDDETYIEEEEKKLKRFIGLLHGGEFLPNLNTPWGDQIKANFEDKVIDYIIGLKNSPVFKKNINIQLSLVDCLFTYAPLNEFALKEKIQILNQLGKRTSAKNVYDIYCSLYEEVLGEKYLVPFKELLKRSS